MLVAQAQEQMMADSGEQIGLATEVTVAWLSNPHTRAQPEDVSTLLGSVLTALRGLDEPVLQVEPDGAAEAVHTPAVTKRKSLASSKHILSMIDGKPYRSLNRHLRTHGLTPDEYRQRYGLKPDYPMIAPTYSAERSAAAKQHGFGRKPAALPETALAPAPEPKAKPGRKSAAQAKRDAQTHLGGSDKAITSKA